jgi:hypothetical protein
VILIIWSYQLIKLLKVAHFEHHKKKVALTKTPPRNRKMISSDHQQDRRKPDFYPDHQQDYRAPDFYPDQKMPLISRSRENLLLSAPPQQQDNFRQQQIISR